MLSASTVFIIGASAPLAGALMVLDTGTKIPDSVWILSAVFGGLTAAKDVRSSLSLPPVEVSRPPVPLPLDKA
jgi:hypothetical protein